MNPDRPFAWLSLEPRHDAAPRPVPPETHPTIVKPQTDPSAVMLKRLRRETRDLRRRMRVLERSREATREKRAVERDGVDVSGVSDLVHLQGGTDQAICSRAVPFVPTSYDSSENSSSITAALLPWQPSPSHQDGTIRRCCRSCTAA